jgi:Protein of unknown function (DUF3179)
MYPVARMPHIIHDFAGGSLLLVVYCAHCRSGVGFVPVVGRQKLTFVTFGAYEGSLVMQDVQTGSLWTEETGQSMAGPLVGEQLTLMPVHLTSAGDWISDFPDSLTPDPLLLDKHKQRPNAALGENWRATVSHWDIALPERTLVLGVRAGTHARAYVIDPDRREDFLYQDQLGEIPIILLGRAGGWPLAYDRRTSHGIVELSLEGSRLIDSAGAEWTVGGYAGGGPSERMHLDFVPSHVVTLLPETTTAIERERRHPR